MIITLPYAVPHLTLAYLLEYHGTTTGHQAGVLVLSKSE